MFSFISYLGHGVFVMAVEKKRSHLVWSVPMLYYCGWFILKERKSVMRTKCTAKEVVDIIYHCYHPSSVRFMMSLVKCLGNTKRKVIIEQAKVLNGVLTKLHVSKERQENGENTSVSCKS